MPFLGRDWRSDGDLWVKTDHGWETMKNLRVRIHENINYKVLQRLLRQSVNEPERSDDIMHCEPRVLYLHIPKIHPCRISQGQSDVVFTQVVSALDLAGAFKNDWRAGYMYKLMELLIEYRIHSMSGAIQNALFVLLENALDVASQKQRNVKQLVHLLEGLLTRLKRYQYQHRGGEFQWSKHYDDVIMMLERARNIKIPVRQDDGGLKITELPYDVIRHVVLHLCTQEDILNAGKACPNVMDLLIQDDSLWRELCLCHFTPQQIYRCRKETYRQSNVNWYKIYANLYRRHGIKELYVDMLSWCKKCRIIFWKATGHPCKFIKEESACSYDLMPADFIKMFNV
ncbi:FBXO32 [Bugula neritina]|uniref:FBXO32 n=1 Tax=Bugula neritina TaxID=10212 RepID=A0A7J7IXH4_BUGNE|nr:FBXO32 [Bugula neritina]